MAHEWSFGMYAFFLITRGKTVIRENLRQGESSIKAGISTAAAS